MKTEIKVAIISSVITGLLGIIGMATSAYVSGQYHERSLLDKISGVVVQSSVINTQEELFEWLKYIQNEKDSLNLQTAFLRDELKEIKEVLEQIKAIPSMNSEGKENNPDINSSVIEFSRDSIMEQSETESTDIENYTDNDFLVEVKVRLVGDPDPTWKNSVDAEIGDRVEFQMQYKNLSDIRHPSVCVRNILPNGLRYVEDSTYLFNTLHPNGCYINEDSIIDDGVNIGNYSPGANAFIRITAEVENDDEKDEPYLLVNWAQGQAGADIGEQYVLQDYATVRVEYSSAKNN